MNTIIFLANVKGYKNLIKIMDDNPILYVILAIFLIYMAKIYIIDVIFPKRTQKDLTNVFKKQEKNDEQEEPKEHQSEQLVEKLIIEPQKAMLNSIEGQLDTFYKVNERSNKSLVSAIKNLDSLNDDDIEKFQSCMNNEINLEVMRVKIMKAIEITDIINTELDEIKKKLSYPPINIEEIEADFEKIHEYEKTVGEIARSDEVLKLRFKVFSWKEATEL